MSDKEFEALQVAVRAHDGQYDKGGSPYILHPITVAKSVTGEKEKVLALLHDTVEDTSVTNDDIRKEFGNTIADALDCLTHRDGESYDDYISRVCTNQLAIDVKLADLHNNMDLSRIPNPTEKDLKRVEKYKRVEKRLLDCKKA